MSAGVPLDDALKKDLARSSQNQRVGKAETAEVTAQISSQKNCRVIRISKWPLIKTGS